MAARLNSDASDLELSESPYVFMADAGRGETERAMKGVATGSLRAEEIALERVQRHHRDAPAPAVKPSERPRGNRASSERAPLSPASTDGDTDVEGQSAPSRRVSFPESVTERDDERLLPASRGTPPPKHHPLKKLNTQTSLDLHELANSELSLKASLYFHISNPIKRWKVERLVPIKLLLQLLKTAVFIIQIILMTVSIPAERTEFIYESRELFANLFIKDFDRENPRAVHKIYTVRDMYEELEYIAHHYFQLENVTLGGYDLIPDGNGSYHCIRVTVKEYKEAYIDPSTNTYVLDGNTIEGSYDLCDPASTGENVTQQFISQSGNILLHNRLVYMEVLLSLRHIRVDDAAIVECFHFDVTIEFKDIQNSGILNYVLLIDPYTIYCNGTMQSLHFERQKVIQAFLTLLDVIIILLCLVSLFLTCATLNRAIKLGRAMGHFYSNQLGLELSWWERRTLFSIWHAFSINSDVLIITGTLCKIMLDFKVNGFLDSTAARVLLGTAVLFQAAVILRYISYFRQLNALTRTLAMAFPELLKFLLCTVILLLAFTFTGWLVLGPYHRKFKDFSVAFETLFSLLNGDDIYETFRAITTLDDLAAYIYSRFYFYVFLILFIYAVLNIFTSLVISAYESSQNINTAEQNEVRRFIFSGPLTANGVALRDVTLTNKYVDPQLILNRRKQREIATADNEIVDDSG